MQYFDRDLSMEMNMLSEFRSGSSIIFEILVHIKQILSDFYAILPADEIVELVTNSEKVFNIYDTPGSSSRKRYAAVTTTALSTYYCIDLSAHLSPVLVFDEL